MVPFVAGVLTGMAAQKVFGESPPELEPVEMREVSEEHVKETLAQAKKPIRINGLEEIPAREVSTDDLPDYIRKKIFKE